MIAPDHQVVELRFRFRRGLRGGHSQLLDIGDQFRGNFRAQLFPFRNLIRRLGRGVQFRLAGQCGIGGQIGGGGGEVVHPDLIGPREVPGHKNQRGW